MPPQPRPKPIPPSRLENLGYGLGDVELLADAYPYMKKEESASKKAERSSGRQRFGRRTRGAGVSWGRDAKVGSGVGTHKREKRETGQRLKSRSAPGAERGRLAREGHEGEGTRPAGFLAQEN